MTRKELVAALQKRISELEEANKKLSAELIYYKEKDAARSDKDSENAQTSKFLMIQKKIREAELLNVIFLRRWQSVSLVVLGANGCV